MHDIQLILKNLFVEHRSSHGNIEIMFLYHLQTIILFENVIHCFISAFILFYFEQFR